MKENKEIYKLNKYCYEVQMVNKEWFTFNLLNFNYIIADRSLFQTNISQLEKPELEILQELEFISKYKEELIFQQKIEEWIKKLFTEYNPDFETLVFKLTPTMLCNFRCSYCYQPDLFCDETRNNAEYMSLEILGSLFDYIESYNLHKGKYKIVIEIVGGEIFLKMKKAFKFVERLVEKALKYEMDLIFVTNGYEIEYFLDILKRKNEVTYNITIDGDKDTHNKRRFLSGGGGSFDKITANIQRIITETEHKIRIRCNIDNQNIDSVPLLLSMMKEKGWLKLDRIDILFRATTKYVHTADFEYPIAKNNISQDNIVKLIKMLIEEKISKARIDGSLVLPLIARLFWSKLFIDNKETISIDNPVIDLLCSANQGHFGSLNIDGSIQPCGFELAHNSGRIFPNEEYDNLIIQYWNSREHLISKFLRYPCNSCCFFFICNKRQCEYEQIEQFDEKLGYCTDIKKNLDTFIRNFGVGF